MPLRLCAFVFLLFLAVPSHARSNSGSPAPGQFVCDTSLDRTREAIALAKFNRERRPAALSTAAEAVTDDRGHIAVLQDDGTVITPANRFDLANSSLTFTPAANGRYSAGIQTADFDPVGGAATGLALRDDDAVQVSLNFPFVFYGASYTSLYVNSDGNLTFTASDTRSTDRNLARIAAGPPRIAPFFNDLDPSSSGRVTVEKFEDRILFTWTNVGEWADAGAVGQNTFQVVLGANGTIRFNYQRIDATEAVVAIGPGASANPTISLVDYLGTAAPTALPGVIAEVFASRLTMDLSQIAQIFYRNHPDSYDEIFVFADFNLSLSPAFAYAVPIRNAERGIMNATGAQGAFYDYGSEFGSGQRLSAMVNMGDLGRFPPDPRQQFLGTNTTLSILGQEFGHRWLAFLDVSTASMLGRADSHWSFLHNTFGSVMEGNEIEDLGNGRFQTVRATESYSPLDQYVMGLRPASEVPPWFVVASPTLTTPIPAGFPASCRNVENLPSCAPFVGLQFSGTRRDVTIDAVLSRAGSRVPSFPQAQKDFRVAFILVTTRGQEPKPASLQTLEAMRTTWVSFFQTAVDGRGTMNADLLYFPSSATEVRTQITANGSRRVETRGTAAPVQVGYATLDSAAGISIVKFVAGGDVRSEAAIPAATLGTAFRVYVERAERVSTGLALLNTSGSAASITAQLSDGQQTTIQLLPRSQKSQFIHELFTNIGTSFSGTL
ncbi:MAG: hypothetical protein HYU27_06740, partial [Acidobacteria bacterium]|nr:hypothetical protein [Acidobacteriota bacterium]